MTTLGHFLNAKSLTETPAIPWSCIGLLLINLISTLVTTATFHPGLSVSERLENSLTAYVLLDLAELEAVQTARERGMSKNQLWLPRQTHSNLQHQCGFIAIACASLPEDTPWFPWRSSELPLEQWFGYLRGQYSSSQMRARDFLHASARKMHQTYMRFTTARHKMGTPIACSPCVAASDAEFADCADRALKSALKLMAICSEFLVCYILVVFFVVESVDSFELESLGSLGNPPDPWATGILDILASLSSTSLYIQ